jgi:hypothetical protein
MISRSNSARAPKIWKISLPPDVVVSMFSVVLKADPPVVEAGDRLDEVGEGTPQSVEAPYDQGIAGPDVVEGVVQPGALKAFSGLLVAVIWWVSESAVGMSGATMATLVNEE